ncbi:MAG: NAD(P)H-hydrate epimerase, partial [Actinomycetota bacterium]
MIPVLSAEDVRRQDAACEARGISTSTLMGNAGYAVARAVRELLGGTYGRRIVVVCGKGNNAGDGLVAGRRLAAWGAHVTAVMTLGNDLTGAARAARQAFPGRVRGAEEILRELD